MKVDIKKSKKQIVLKIDLVGKETYKVSDKHNIFSFTAFKKPQVVRGITSLCKDMKHILFLDWDNVCRWIVEAELEELSMYTSPFYLFTTKEKKLNGELVGHYHAICLQKFHPIEVLEMQRRTSCDNAYITMPLRNRYRSWVLRQSDKKGSGKPKFIKLIGNKNINQQISSAHLKILREIYKLPLVPYTNKDGLKTIYVNQYETG